MTTFIENHLLTNHRLMLPTNIKYLRNYTGLTQADFGKKFNVTRGMQDSYERGIAKPSTEYLNQLAKYFKMPLDVITDKDLRLNPGFLFAEASVPEQQSNVMNDLLRAKEEMIEELKKRVKFLEQTIERLTPSRNG